MNITHCDSLMPPSTPNKQTSKETINRKTTTNKQTHNNKSQRDARPTEMNTLETLWEDERHKERKIQERFIKDLGRQKRKIQEKFIKDLGRQTQDPGEIHKGPGETNDFRTSKMNVLKSWTWHRGNVPEKCTCIPRRWTFQKKTSAPES